MILQPIVENSIKHGFKDIGWGKRVELVIERQEDDLVMSVTDNGVGMTREQIDRILGSRQPDKPQAEEGGIGLDNVITRLHTFYNYTDEVEIISEGENMGTTVRFVVPIEKREQQDVQNNDRR